LSKPLAAAAAGSPPEIVNLYKEFADFARGSSIPPAKVSIPAD
jgi:hypothetical protein